MELCTASKVLLKQFHAKDITPSFLKHYAINPESGMKCKAALEQWSVSKNVSKCPPLHVIQKQRKQCYSDSGLLLSQQNHRDLAIKTELPKNCKLEKEILREANCEADKNMQTIDQSFSLANEQGYLQNGMPEAISDATTDTTKAYIIEHEKISKNVSCKGRRKWIRQCQHCEYTTVWTTNLKSHMRIHTGDLFHCEYCKFTTKRNWLLKSHMRIHTGDLLHCQHCEYRTAWSSDMGRHIRIHTGNLFQCNYCEYKTYRSGDLKRHMRSHTDKLLQCANCDYRTAWPSNMKKHIRIHSGQLVCKYCEYRATAQSCMTIHMRKHAAVLLKCEYCEYRIPYSNVMEAHVLKFH